MKPAHARLTVANATEFCKELLWWIESGNDHILDLSNTTQVDISAVQLLISTKKYAAARNKTFKIINASDDIISVISIVGAKKMLGV